MSYQNYRPSGFSFFPPVIKNLMIINGLFFLAVNTIHQVDLASLLGLHSFESKLFHPFQLVTHFFLHVEVSHLLSNLIMLWVFGTALENYWGGKRFLIYYMLTGFGAAILSITIHEFQIYRLAQHLSPEDVRMVMDQGYDLLLTGHNYSDPDAGKLNILINTVSFGASGAVFGVLLAFGMTFPNDVILVSFLFPVKAKYLVAFYGFMELYIGLQNNPGDPIGHAAHIGGMIFGYFILRYWNKH